MNEENRPQDPNAPRAQEEHGSAPPPPQSYLAAPGAITPEPPAAPQASQLPPLPAPVAPPPAAVPPPPPPVSYYQPPVTPTAPPSERNVAPPPPPQWAPRPPMPPPPGGGYPQPGYGGYPPPPPKGRNRLLPVIAGLVLLVVVLVGAGGVLLLGSLGSSGGTKPVGGGFGFGSFGSKVAVLEIEDVIAEGEGTLANTKVLVNQIDAWRQNSSIKALVLRINSPGGAVSATQDLYSAINRYKAETGNPVIASLGDVAASGGYYAAVAADEIWANEGSLTGSIGVIMSFMDYQGLQDKVGIHSRTVKSGEFKDMGSGSRAMTEREKELLGNMITDVYEQFFEAVYEGRKGAVRALLSADNQTSSTLRESDIRDHLRAYADGRIFSGRQARSMGMIDEIGTLDDAVEHAAKLAKISGEPTIVRGPARPTGLFGGMGAMMNRFSSITPVGKPGVTVEYRLGSY